MFDIDVTKNERLFHTCADEWPSFSMSHFFQIKKQEQITVQYILRIFPQTYLIHKHLLFF